MAQGPLGGPRPGSNSTLRMVIVENPVPVKGDTGVFPQKIIRTGGTEENIISDIAGRTVFRERDLSVDIKSSFQRGLGQTDRFIIKADVSGMRPESIDNAIDKLVDDGYQFSVVEFE
jgi:hypothetical protein